VEGNKREEESNRKLRKEREEGNKMKEACERSHGKE
jgi:hypothetical protein